MEIKVDEYAGLKFKYNTTLKRYFAGCNYIMEHEEETDKYLPKVIELQDTLEEIIKKFARDGKPMTEREILMGFEK